MSESVFVARVQRARRVVIPKVICELLKIEEGDTVRITISREDVFLGKEKQPQQSSEPIEWKVRGSDKA